MNDDREEILRVLGEVEITPPLPTAPALMQVDGALPEAFMRAAVANKCEVVQVDSAAQAPAQVAAYLRKQGVALQVVCESDLQELPWTSAGVEVLRRAVTAEDVCGVTGVAGAAADTGAMLLCDDVPERLTLSLLPPHHVAIVPAELIVADLAELWKRMPQPLPRGNVLVGGPSRTADIEQTLTLGVHGPVGVLVVVTT